MEDAPTRSRPPRSVLYRVLLTCTSVFAAMAIGEAVLRIFPVRGTGFGTRVFDPDIKIYKFTPRSKVVVTNVRNERIVRDVNREGWLDRDHTPEKPEGTYRIGFFGDSYVEALQVKLEHTFFRIVEEKLSGRNVETLAFGHSGFGPIHNCLVSEKYAPHFDLDLVVYVFFENDPGDQTELVKTAASMVYARLEDGEVLVDDTLQAAERRKVTAPRRLGFLNHSALYRNTYIRLKLTLDVRQADKRPGIPDQNDPPSTWPAHLVEEAKTLSEAVISKWAAAVKKSARRFAVFYVPVQGQFDKRDVNQDTWKHWLKTFCVRNDITFIDACDAFAAAEREGRTVHDDHFSVDGHRVFADVFVNWFETTQ